MDQVGLELPSCRANLEGVNLKGANLEGSIMAGAGRKFLDRYF